MEGFKLAVFSLAFFVTVTANKRTCWCDMYIGGNHMDINDKVFNGFALGCKRPPHWCQSHCSNQARTQLQNGNTCQHLKALGVLANGKQTFQVEAKKKTSNCGDEFRWAVGSLCCDTVNLLAMGLSQEVIDSHFGGIAIKTKNC